MGCVTAKQTVGSKKIDTDIKQDRKKQELKLLLLGTGDSGKSTFMKQMKVLHLNGFSKSEIAKYANVLKDNLLTAIKLLIENAKKSNYKLAKKNKAPADKILQSTRLTVELVSDIKKLWADKGIKKAWQIRNQFQIPGVADYYVDHIDRIAEEDYVPTNEDVFRAKLKTTGVTETKFELQKVTFNLVDVGGQRTERRKWLHCFDSVTSVLYLAALDEYDMTLAEDNVTNRMTESLQLFGEVSGSQYFQKTSWILFLNKSDLFETKLKENPQGLKKLFPDYSGGTDFEAGVEFVKGKYKERFSGNALYIYQTCALDTQNIERVFAVVKDTILLKNLTAMYFT